MDGENQRWVDRQRGVCTRAGSGGCQRPITKALAPPNMNVLGRMEEGAPKREYSARATGVGPSGDAEWREVQGPL